MDSYLDPEIPDTVRILEAPVVRATDESLRGYGRLVDDPHGFPIEIVTWPQPGWRAMDPGTGNEGGTTTGEFDFWWEGDVMLGKNHAVGSNEYLFGWSCEPKQARRDRATRPRDQVLIWHANYHPDGGQLFFPKNGEAFLCPLALPGDDVKPEDFVAFYVEGGKGLYIHPNVWHEAVFPLAERARFHDEQGKVHARISCNFAREFGVLLGVKLSQP
jgi:ureidoglycolate lyase